MEITCPSCSNQIVFGEKPPKFCDQCGTSIASELTKIGQVNQPDTAAIDAEATIAPSGKIITPVETPKDDHRTINQYELLGQLGSGGMGVVYEACDKTTGRHVAVKLLSSGLTSDRENVDRFVQEAKLAAQISHPRTTFIYEAGEFEGRPYIVMELMPGQTLQDILEKEESLPVNQAVDYIIDVIDGLVAAHDLNFIHRDVKPSNCFVAADGRIKVGDFGLSKSLVTDLSLTRTGTFMGTPLYAAPEQIRGTQVDHRVDIYSVGATLFTLIAGKPPFDGDAMSVTAQILTDPAPNIRTVQPNVPKDLARIIEKTLRKDPSERYANLAELKKSLAPFASGGASLTQIGRRSAAYMIDYVFTTLVCQLTIMCLVFIFITPKQINNPGMDMSVHIQRLQIFASLGIWLFVWLYFAILEGFWGTTIGKKILGLKVVNNQGEKPGIFRGLLRSFAVPSAFAIPIFVTLIRLLWVSEDFQEIRMTSVIYGWTSARLAEVLPALVCLLTMKQSNGLRGLHGLLSGTRVFRINRAEHRVIKDMPSLNLTDVAEKLQFGTYQVSGLVAGDKSYRVFQACDEVLGRQVWIYYGNHQKPGVQNHHVIRNGRFRWIQGGEVDGTRWDAYEVAEGLPFNLAADVKELFVWENTRFALQDFCDELDASLDDETLGSDLCLDQFFIDKNGRGKFLEIALPGQQAESDSTETKSPAKSACEIVQQAFDLVLQRQQIPQSASQLLGDFGKQTKKPETISRFAEKLGDQNSKLASLQWDSRLGILAVTLGVEWVVLTGFILLVGFGVFSLIGYLPLWKPALVASIFATGFFLAGYIHKTSPVFHFMGIDIQKKNGGLASRFQCGCRMLLSWMPFAIAFIGVLMSMMVGFDQMKHLKEVRRQQNSQLETAETVGQNGNPNSDEPVAQVAEDIPPPKNNRVNPGLPKDVEKHAIQFLIVIFASCIATFIALMGTLVSVLIPERGIQDWMVGTRLVPK